MLDLNKKEYQSFSNPEQARGVFTQTPKSDLSKGVKGYARSGGKVKVKVLHPNRKVKAVATIPAPKLTNHHVKAGTPGNYKGLADRYLKRIKKAQERKCQRILDYLARVDENAFNFYRELI